mmetsp:Transcript_100780/g.200213  ORF Transcript_100780/g.200213 Transcript_100780/m.200213 type:complete len:207 (-) Transcript_100780:177-797(-)
MSEGGPPECRSNRSGAQPRSMAESPHSLCSSNTWAMDGMSHSPVGAGQCFQPSSAGRCFKHWATAVTVYQPPLLACCSALRAACKSLVLPLPTIFPSTALSCCTPTPLPTTITSSASCKASTVRGGPSCMVKPACIKWDSMSATVTECTAPHPSAGRQTTGCLCTSPSTGFSSTNGVQRSPSTTWPLRSIRHVEAPCSRAEAVARW